SATDHESHYVVLPCAERNANADLSIPLRNGIADDAIDPDGTKQEGKARECSEKQHCEARLGDRIRHKLVHRPYLAHWYRRVDAPNRAMDLCSDHVLW